MNLASNIVGGILSSQIGSGQGNITNVFNLNDKAFAEILEKQLNNQSIDKTGFYPAGMGMPVGLDIQDPDKSLETTEITDREFKQTGYDNFARRHAAEFYGKCAGNVVINLSEFVNDTIKIN